MTFSAIDAQNLAPYGHLEEFGSQIANAPLIFPGVRGKLKKSLTVEGTQLLAGTPVIIQPLNPHQANAASEFIITPYKNNKKTARSNQPESKRDIIPGKSYKVTTLAPDQMLSFNNEHFRRRTDVLFPRAHSPSLEEIKQCRIPNCFLLAAIQAILNHPNGQAFIRGMMRQNDDGTTTVRLYDPETFEPQYIRVENSVIVDSFGALNGHEALWVHVLEKAFAARGQKNLKTTDASVSSVFSGGGLTHLALQSLTGIKTDSFLTKPPAFPWQVDKFLAENTYHLIKNLITLPGVLDAQIINCLTMLKPAQLALIYDYFGAKANDQESEFAALTQYASLIKCHFANPALYNTAIQTRSAAKIQADYPEAAAILEKIFAKTAAFSGFYSQYEVEMYQTFSDGLRDGKLLTAGTPSKFDEKIVGIIDRHAYTVLGVFEKSLSVKDENGEVKTIRARFVKLRNPWGDAKSFEGLARDLLSRGVSRVYEQHGETLDIRVKNSNDAEFIVELSDFQKYFRDYDVSSSANETFHRDAEKEKYMAEVTQFIDDFRIDFTSSNSDLIEANTAYQQQLKNLINIELLELKRLDSSLIDSINEIFNQGFDLQPDGVALERKSVQGLIDETLFPTVAGNTPEKVKEHIYLLLKLNWLQAQANPDKSALSVLLDAIQQHQPAHPVLWEHLSTLNMMLNTIMMTRVNNNQGSVDYMLALADGLKADIKKFKNQLKQDKQIDSLAIDALLIKVINNFVNLERLYHEFLNMELLARNFGYSGNHDAFLSEIAPVIDKYSPYIERLANVKDQFQALWKLREEIRAQAVDMEQQHELTTDERERVREATDYLFSGKMECVGKEFLSSRSKSKRELGEKIVKADSLVKKIQQALQWFGSFALSIFHKKNTYELPARENHTSRPGRVLV